MCSCFGSPTWLCTLVMFLIRCLFRFSGFKIAVPQSQKAQHQVTYWTTGNKREQRDAWKYHRQGSAHATKDASQRGAGAPQGKRSLQLQEWCRRKQERPGQDHHPHRLDEQGPQRWQTGVVVNLAWPLNARALGCASGSTSACDEGGRKKCALLCMKRSTEVADPWRFFEAPRENQARNRELQEAIEYVKTQQNAFFWESRSARTG